MMGESIAEVAALQAAISFMPEACRHALVGQMPCNATSKTRARLVAAGVWMRGTSGSYEETPFGRHLRNHLKGADHDR